jgi:hypothetical protein
MKGGVFDLEAVAICYWRVKMGDFGGLEVKNDEMGDFEVNL